MHLNFEMWMRQQKLDPRVVQPRVHGRVHNPGMYRIETDEVIGTAARAGGRFTVGRFTVVPYEGNNAGMEAHGIIHGNDGCFHVTVQAFDRLDVADANEHIDFYDQIVPRWVPLWCGHLASNLTLGVQHRRLAEIALPQCGTTARCSICKTILFPRTRFEIIDANGLNNYVCHRE
jgi:hypothetical protein